MYCFLPGMVPEPRACHGLMALRALQGDDVQVVFSDKWQLPHFGTRLVLSALYTCHIFPLDPLRSCAFSNFTNFICRRQR
eukprot:Skav231717  [mRNA]  locus=scaffold2515:20153:20612:- [translate_table: standard]